MLFCFCIIINSVQTGHISVLTLIHSGIWMADHDWSRQLSPKILPETDDVWGKKLKRECDKQRIWFEKMLQERRSGWETHLSLMMSSASLRVVGLFSLIFLLSPEWSLISIYLLRNRGCLHAPAHTLNRNNTAWIMDSFPFDYESFLITLKKVTFSKTISLLGAARPHAATFEALRAPRWIKFSTLAWRFTPAAAARSLLEEYLPTASIAGVASASWGISKESRTRRFSATHGMLWLCVSQSPISQCCGGVIASRSPGRGTEEGSISQRGEIEARHPCPEYSNGEKKIPDVWKI